ncbi:MAG TPA: sigma-E factor regulatory protein RseB domain-containing protein [Fimbriimonadaceae bacterium]|nr:sigma-E factor regulatory protein RseB domain-containing protein [Fimbriimonadaceae bacterium]
MNALNLLLKALDGQRSVRATLLQRRADGGAPISVTVQIDPQKGIRATITRPFVYAGAISFDNGTEWRNYDPHDNVLRIERSPYTFRIDPVFRARLIEKNFEVTFEKDTDVAGRNAKIVYMKGLDPEVSDFRLAIDAANYLILRYEVVQPDGKKLTMVETTQVQVGVPPIGNSIENIAPDDAQIKREWGPVQIASPGQAQLFAGFTPVLPKQFPAGLALQAIHIMGDSAKKFVAVRLSDGMSVATVYLWARMDEDDEPFSGEADGTSLSGIKVRVLGEVSAATKRRLANDFLSLNEHNLGPLEQHQTSYTFILNRPQAWGEPLLTGLYFGRNQ